MLNNKIKKLSACLAVCATFATLAGGFNNAEAKVSAQDKSRAKQLYSQCTQKFDNGDIKGAAACFMEADKIAVENPLYKVLTADSLKTLKQYPSAIRYYESAIEYAAKDKKMKDKIIQKSYIGLAESYAETKDMDKALEYADKSIKEYDKDYRGHYIKALVLQDKDKNAAIEEYKKSLDVDKTQYNSYAKLIRMYKDMGKVDEAIKTYEMAMDYRPLDEDMKMALAQLYMNETKKEGAKVNYYPKATEVLKSLIAVNNQNAMAHYYLSTLYLLQDDKENCYNELSTTNSLNAGLGNRLNKEIQAYLKKSIAEKSKQAQQQNTEGNVLDVVEGY